MTDKVLDFLEKRKENIEQKRRQFERILFNNFLGAYTVVDQGGSIYPVNLVDVSREGCLFQVPWNVDRDTKIAQGTEITMRMYFTKNSFIPVVMNVKYDREFIDEDGLTYMQYGAEFDTSMPSFAAVETFIEFMYKFAEHSSFDKGSHKVYFL
ncbi:MAG: PilZ domain-containing protein [Bacteriovoracaceae bacterium]|nr:PilZ domain-containing protein [Bacteriovoracaceae bacterium]